MCVTSVDDVSSEKGKVKHTLNAHARVPEEINPVERDSAGNLINSATCTLSIRPANEIPVNGNVGKLQSANRALNIMLRVFVISRFHRITRS